MKNTLAAFALLAISLAPAEVASEGADVPVAVFPFELIDTSLDGELLGKNAAEQARIKLMAPRVREAYGRAGGYRVVESAALDAEAATRTLRNCGSCDVVLARKAGASLSVTGTVQKVSNLILNVNIYVKDVDSGKVVAAGSADIRSNTDDSWLRGVDWLMKHRILKAG